MSRPSIMVGITTYNRPTMLDKTIRAVRDHLAPICDQVLIHNDGSSLKFNAEYQRAYKRLPSATIQHTAENHGVAYSKNALLDQMHDDGADYLFLLEDDITPLHQDAILGYIRAMEATGIQHLSFAHHGPANLNVPDSDGPVSYFPHSIGAWTVFTKTCLEDVGLMDENFVCAWEHVEHEIRLIQAGYMPGASVHHFPDATGSAQWLKELPGSIEASSIRPRGDWQSNIRNGLIYWRDNKPETFDLIFGDDKPLHNYAMSIIR